MIVAISCHFLQVFCAKPLLLVLLTATGLVFAAHVSTAAGQPSLPVVGVWSSLYSSSNVTDASIQAGSSIVFEVNVTGAPVFNGYELTLFYDPSFLKAQSIDFTSGTVFNAPFVAKNDLVQAGIVAVAVVNLGSPFAGASGILLHIKFQVTGVGVSPLSLAGGTANPSAAAQSWTRLVMGFNPIDVATSDGYFKNDGSRLGPVALYSTSPSTPLLGGTVLFDASQSFDPDNNTGPNAGLMKYSWDFGDGFSTGTFFPAITHHFGVFQPPPGFSGNFSVRLTVTDANDGFEGMTGRIVTVSNTLQSLTNFLISPNPTSISFLPGGRLQDSVMLQSTGGFLGNVSVAARVDPTIPNGPVVSVSPSAVLVAQGGPIRTIVTVNTTSSTPSGNYVVVVTGTSGSLSQVALILVSVLRSSFFPNISVRNFFTDGAGSLLPVDSTGSPSVNVVFARGVIRATNPGQIVAWVNVTNDGTIPFSSLKMEERLPVDWVLSPFTPRSRGEIHAFFQFKNGTLLDITTVGTIGVSGLNPETINLILANLTNTPAGKTLAPGESVLLSVKLAYGLIGTAQPPGRFPLSYGIASQAVAWVSPLFMGDHSSDSSSAFFNADAKLMGDVNGDMNVNILDAALVAYSFGARPGGANWNPGADLDGDHHVDIADLAQVGFNFGDSFTMP
jgi:hypothetical protein